MKIIKTIILLAICQITLGQFPEIRTKLDGENHNLTISKMNVDVTIIGNIATTTYDIVFSNPFLSDLEGELSMALDEGQEISRYALEINGQLREGVMVEKVKARQTFEAVVRQNIDPGIINLTKGNNFTTRIYPIPANGNKRLVLAVTGTLKGDSKNLYYQLPFSNAKAIGDFSLNVKVYKNSGLKRNSIKAFDNVKFDDLSDVYLMSFNRKNFQSNQPLKFTIPRFPDSDYQLFTGVFNNETYFYLNFKTAELKSQIKKTPEKILIYWDNSFSASRRDKTKELELLRSYLTSLNGRKLITVIPFNIIVGNEVEFIVDSEPDALISFLGNLNNDGATRLDVLKPRKYFDEILLFTDGVNTIGSDDIADLNIPVYTITSGLGANYDFLQSIATITNGGFVNLNTIAPERALNSLLYLEDKFLSCFYNSKDLSEVYPDVAQRAGEYFEIAGKLLSDGAELTVNFGSRKDDITSSRTFVIQNKNIAPVERIWASKKIQALNSDYKNNKDDIFALGSQFNIVTRDASLIVLDRTEDYLMHGILPPAELMDEYNRLLAMQRLPETDDIDIVKLNLERFDRLKAWYNNPQTFYRELKDSSISEVFMIMDSESDVVLEEEIIPVTRQENINPPPPPPGVTDILMIVNDDVELSEELRIEGAFDMPPGRGRSSERMAPTVKVLAWQPDAPYMDSLRNSSINELEPLYFRLKEEYLNQPSFFIQVSDFFFAKKMRDVGIRILSNVVEMELENPELLKVAARRLLDEGETKLAIFLYEEIKQLRPEEPQSLRDLALALIKDERYQDALSLFVQIIDNNWGRFEDIKDVVFNELNHLVFNKREWLDLKLVHPEYIFAMPFDVRICIDWSSNDNDIDLWVIDPDGEKCFYQNQNTKMGGKISRDFTQGYGPEEFALKTAKRGFYTVFVNYFNDSRQKIAGPVTVYATITTLYGTKTENTQRISIQLSNNKETTQIGLVEFGN